MSSIKTRRFIDEAERLRCSPRSEDAVVLGDIMERARRAAKLSVEGVARALSIAPLTIRRLETGAGRSRRASLLAIVKFYESHGVSFGLNPIGIAWHGDTVGPAAGSAE